MYYLNVTQTIDYLQRNAKLGNSNIEVDRKFLHKLDETCRLLPDKHDFLGRKYYSLSKLRHYVHDVKPR